MELIDDTAPESRKPDHGPVMVSMQVRFIVPSMRDEEGEAMEGNATYNFPAGTYPTQAEIAEAVQKAFEEVRKMKQCKDARLMSPREFRESVLLEKTGMRFAAPGKDTWDPIQ